MDEEAAAAEDGAPRSLHVRSRHIKKRALKNKSLSVSFNEKGLKDFVTGFHKRKKKRRKEALQKQEEAERRKRIEQRKKRKLERDFVIYGGALPASGTDAAESNEEHEDEEETEPVSSVSGIALYDHGDVQVMVTTSEIAKEEDYPIERPEAGRPEFVECDKSKQRKPLGKKKQLKKAPKKRSHPKPQSKREKKKGKKKNNKHQL